VASLIGYVILNGLHRLNLDVTASFCRILDVFDVVYHSHGVRYAWDDSASHAYVGCVLLAWPGWPGPAGPGPAVLF